MKCSPHHWRMPVVGDDALECETCGRTLDYCRDMTPNMRSAILNGYERRCGRDAVAAFREALHTAEDDRRARYDRDAEHMFESGIWILPEDSDCPQLRPIWDGMERIGTLRVDTRILDPERINLQEVALMGWPPPNGCKVFMHGHWRRDTPPHRETTPQPAGPEQMPVPRT